MLSTLTLRTLGNQLQPRLSFQNNFTRLVNKGSPYSRFLVPTVSSFAYLYLMNNQKIECYDRGNTENDVQKFEDRRKAINLQTISSKTHSIWATGKSIMAHVLRFFQLILIFAPVALLYPLRFFDKTREMWMDLFVKSV